MKCQICGVNNDAYLTASFNDTSVHTVSTVTLNTYAGVDVTMVLCDVHETMARSLNNLPLECTSAGEIFNIASEIYSDIKAATLIS